MISMPYCKPSITEREVNYAEQAAMWGWGERAHEWIERFEGMFRSYCGAQYAIATSSCTGALHLGMAAMKIGKGDTIALADSNWIATVSPVVHLGASPYFVDILMKTWCINPEVKVKYSAPKAIIATHLYGNLCDMDKLLKNPYGAPVIEDAAEAIGSSYKGKMAGSMGIFGAFSFHGSKTVTTGEGGMLVTNDEALYKRALTLSNHGRPPRQARQFWPEMIGFKYKMSPVQAAIGCAQMERISELVKRKQQILKNYKALLYGVPDIKMNPNQSGCINGAWMPTIVVYREQAYRDILLSKFQKSGIDARVFFWPLSSMRMFAKQTGNKNSYWIQKRAINLPSFHDMTDGDQERVANVVKEALG